MKLLTHDPLYETDKKQSGSKQFWRLRNKNGGSKENGGTFGGWPKILAVGRKFWRLKNGSNPS